MKVQNQVLGQESGFERKGVGEGEERLGPYRLEREIARGGMGVISLAYDLRCDRHVALKEMRPEVKEQEGAVRRFLSEARITASLTHPNIIAIYEIFEAGAKSYYTMPYLEGMSLRHALLRARKEPRSFPVSKALDLFVTAARAIAYAHSQNIVHRDIKADNIWLMREEDVVILDWGVAKKIEPLSSPPLLHSCFPRPFLPLHFSFSKKRGLSWGYNKIFSS